MTTLTREQWATHVLQDTGQVGEDETPTAEALAKAMVICEGAIGMLAAKNIPIWNGSDDSIPHEYLIPLTNYTSPIIAKSSGQIGMAECLQLMRAAEADLRILGATPATGVVQDGDYF